MALVATAMLAALPAMAEENLRPRLTVSGEATIAVEPDLAQLRAGVTSEGKTAREAAEANSKTMTGVMAAVRAIGIADRDVQTSRYMIHPVYDSRRPPNRIVGFQAANSLQIKVRQLDKLGEIVDRLVAAGANTMSGVEFIVSDPSKLLDDARTQAFADARRKAQLYAAAAGVTLGPAITITEQSAGMQFAPVMARAAPAAAETPIAPGERTLRVSVSVSFELR